MSTVTVPQHEGTSFRHAIAGAIDADDVAAAQALLEKKPSLSLRSGDRDLLYHAIFNQSPEMLRLLLDHCKEEEIRQSFFMAPPPAWAIPGCCRHCTTRVPG